VTETIDSLPITETAEPATQDELASVVKESFESETVIYPTGGETSLGFGLPAKKEGLGLSTRQLNRVVDYPARDMTITVESGVTMQQLAETLKGESQFLPVDVPQADKATLGGVIATNWNGPRRFGYGALRDYVIGISAVDGRGATFKGGGRVVKNVAGYDFCKLLTGSLGTLGIITQVTLKLKPQPYAAAVLKCELPSLEQAEVVLNTLVRTKTTPSMIELLLGPAWNENPLISDGGEDAAGGRVYLLVGVEGTSADVNWMVKKLPEEWRGRGISKRKTSVGDKVPPLVKELADFPAGESPLVIKASVVPSGTVRLIAAAREIDPRCSIQAHAGNGIVIVRFSEFPRDGLSRALVGKLQPIAASYHGHIVVLSNPGGSEMTHQCVWGGNRASFEMMTRVKEQFDPKDLLNPGRFVYS